MDRMLRVHLLNSVLSGLIDIKIVTLVIVFRRSVHQFLCRVNSRGDVHQLIHFFRSDGRDRGRTGGRAVVPVILTYVDVTGGCINTLVIVRQNIPLGSVVSANRRVSTGVGRHLVRGVFFGGSPLRSKTVIMDGGQVVTTNYVLPIDRGLSVPGRLKLHRHTTLNVSRDDSTVTIVISRRAKQVDITVGNRFGLQLSTRRLRDVLARRVLWRQEIGGRDA